MKLITSKRGAAVLKRLANRGALDLARVEKTAAKIAGDVRKSGDAALLRYARKFDSLSGKTFRVSQSDIDDSWRHVTPEFRAALETAAENIRRFAEWQKPLEWMRDVQSGVRLGQMIRPIDSVGCYVPGGRHPLPSTLLMTVIPAQIAGVPRVAVVSPTKIVGPGNAFVTAAKKLVAFDCSIDMLAGPTEVVIVSDTGNAAFIAADLVAQAEHDPQALAIFLTSSELLAKQVVKEAERQSAANHIARQSLRKNGFAVVTSSSEESMQIANQLAPEHITVPSQREVAAIQSAGSVFVGDYSPQATGDYASGPNDVLPTGGSARFRGGLSVLDFLKIITVQQLSREGLGEIAGCVTALANAEGLKAHAKAVHIRLRQ